MSEFEFEFESVSVFGSEFDSVFGSMSEFVLHLPLVSE
jgi:hypothetical protein